jgi:aminoglycoside phosphotransferase (APT) family kinase protein
LKELRKELKIVKALTKVSDENHIVLNDIGWTSRVYIVDGGDYVFKFLKNNMYQEELEHEINILKLIKNHEFKVHIPFICWVGEDSAYLGFRGVKGKSMTTKIVNDLSEAQKRNVGTQIGLFIKKLHAIDYKGTSPNSENHVIEELVESYRKRKRTLKKYFNENELASIDKLVTDFPEKSANYGIEEVFSHGDLGYNNIVLSNHLEVGVIDFGDACMLDKSYDFIGLEDDVILEAAISAYGGDSVLKEKISIRRQLLPLMEMLFLMDRKATEEIEKCAGKMRENISSSAN